MTDRLTAGPVSEVKIAVGMGKKTGVGLRELCAASRLEASSLSGQEWRR
jgi:hypothetical protein